MKKTLIAISVFMISFSCTKSKNTPSNTANINSTDTTERCWTCYLIVLRNGVTSYDTGHFCNLTSREMAIQSDSNVSQHAQIGVTIQETCN